MITTKRRKGIGFQSGGVAALAVALLVSCAAHHKCSKCEAKGHSIAAVAHEARPAEDRARDADRRPVAILEFAGIERGSRVLDLASGGGYYAEILANAVGSEGSLTVHNAPWALEKFGDMGMPARLQKPNMAGVSYVQTSLDALELEPDSLDVVMIVLFYHDTYWQKIDRAAMNASLLRALVPGGRYVVIDHHAEAGSGARDVETLHRVDAEEVKGDVLAAGFELDGESDVLRRSEDDRKLGVFDKAIRGKTDRFAFRFRKPRAP